MADTDWACVAPGTAAPTSVHAELIAVESSAARADLLAEWGRFVRALDDRAAFVATAANCGRDAATLRLWAGVRNGVVPADRAATHARVAWHTAAALVGAGAFGSDQPDQALDALAVELAGRAGFQVDRPAVERFFHHEAAARAAVDGGDPAEHLVALRAAGARTPRAVAAGGLLRPDAAQRALDRAYDALESARHVRVRAEVAAVELVAYRALAQSLGEELERDEWIRARLRTLKQTPPARALIAARKRLRPAR
jgi:hypothetical protein